MSSKKSKQNKGKNTNQLPIPDNDKVGPPFTTSIDASVPGEQIISVIYESEIRKWIAIQKNQDGTLHFGVGNTEPLARRIAALEGIEFQRKDRNIGNDSLSKQSLKYLSWKDQLRNLTNRQREIINILLFALSKQQNVKVEKNKKLDSDSYIVDTVIMMVQAIGISCNSIYKLSTNTEMTIRDCFPIARSIVETAINIGFILASGKEKAERARQHALQKYYRDLRRSVNVGGVNLTVEYATEIPVDAIPGLEDAIAEFTTNRGSEDRNWTSENIDQRIEIVTKRYGTKATMGFGASRFSIYRHSSEIIHGTFFGVQYFWQPTLVEDMGNSKSTMIQHYYSHFLTIFAGTFFAIDSLFQVFDIEYGIPEIREAAEELFQEFSELEFVKAALSESDKC